jgi:hypothetical protein
MIGEIHSSLRICTDSLHKTKIPWAFCNFTEDDVENVIQYGESVSKSVKLLEILDFYSIHQFDVIPYKISLKFQ